MQPAEPTTASELQVAWIFGADVLNIDPSNRTSSEERIAEEMLARRDRIDLI